jgi:hypothetical protein
MSKSPFFASKYVKYKLQFAVIIVAYYDWDSLHLTQACPGIVHYLSIAVLAKAKLQ